MILISQQDQRAEAVPLQQGLEVVLQHQCSQFPGGPCHLGQLSPSKEGSEVLKTYSEI